MKFSEILLQNVLCKKFYFYIYRPWKNIANHLNVNLNISQRFLLYILHPSYFCDVWAPEAVVRRCSVKKVFLETLAKSTGMHLCQSLFFNEVAGLTEHLLWLLLEHSYVSSWIKYSWVRKLHSQREVAVAYFFLYFLYFETFNNAKRAVSSEFRPEIFSFENKTALTEVFEHFYYEKNKENPLVSC